jgi:hypothetical protein
MHFDSSRKTDLEDYKENVNGEVQNAYQRGNFKPGSPVEL